MKRQLVSKNMSRTINKIRKLKGRSEQKQVFNDDILYEIISFLDFRVVLCCCTLVSKQLLNVIRNYSQLSIKVMGDISPNLVLKLMNSQFLKNFNSVTCGYGLIMDIRFFKTLGMMKNLKSLDLTSKIVPAYLTGRRIRIGDTGARIISTDIPQLTRLYYGFAGIGDGGAKAISQLNQLTDLELMGNSISIDGLKSICELKNLTTLNLKDNNIGTYEGLKMISDGLPQLIALNVSETGIYLDNSLKPIQEMKCLLTLDVDSNEMGPKGAEIISEMRQLTSLSIRNNMLGESGAKYISKLTNLTTLNIQTNRIGDSGAKFLSEIKTLTKLDMSFNQLSTHIYESIKGMKQLKELIVIGNNIDEKGVRSM